MAGLLLAQLDGAPAALGELTFRRFGSGPHLIGYDLTATDFLYQTVVP